MSLTYDTRENERLTYVSSDFDTCTSKNAAIYIVVRSKVNLDFELSLQKLRPVSYPWLARKFL